MSMIEIFRAGKRPDANGQVVTITAEQLQQAAAHYDPTIHEAPIVIGHPQHNHPAYGWVKGLSVDGDILKAEVHQVDPVFAEMVREGKFKKISASFYLPDSPTNPKQGALTLRHVGFLGAMPPAVKGLRNPEFKEHEEGVIDFTQWEEAILLRRLRNWMIAKFGLEDADNALPEFMVRAVQDSVIRDGMALDNGNAASFSEPIDAPTDPEPKGDFMSDEEKQRLAELEAENARLKAEKEASDAKQAQTALAAEHAENVNYAETLVKAGKLPPVAKDAAVKVLNTATTLGAGMPVDFNEGDSLVNQLKQFLDTLPQFMHFSEFATPEKTAQGDGNEVNYAETDDPARIELDKRIRAYMHKHQVDYSTAASAVA